MPEPHHSDLILPSQQQATISELLTSLKRASLSIHNRLASIRSDARFVSRVAACYSRGRPLVANERCGSWYVAPGDKAASAYFKSTDGHERAWKFSTRRLNLQLIDLIEKNDGVIIVDSTRRGKKMPDALSTTIPIWCAVLNQALLPSHPLSSKLFLPPYMSSSTHSQITALLPSFVSSLLDLNLSLPNSLTKPLRPVWVTQDSSLGDEPVDHIFDDFRPVICCTASRRVVGSEMDGTSGYIQGAADDTENWAHGLTPAVFWENIDLLLETEEDDLPGLIDDLLRQHESERKETSSPIYRLTPQISVTTLPIPSQQPGTESECHVCLTDKVTVSETWIVNPRSMSVGLGKNKAASRNLRISLPEICAFVAKFLESQTLQGTYHGQVVVACETGKDLSVGVALALSCYLFDESGNLRSPNKRDMTFTKSLVKARLAGIMTVYPAANPSRNTLQSVNSFLMDWQK